MNILLYAILFLLQVLTMQSQELRKTLNNLPDTGQNTGYTTIFGEDADYSVFPPNYSDMNNGSVLDNITGLQWQKIDAGEMTHEQATLYADTCTLAGFTDWRLPSPLEAYSIILFSRNKPPLDITFFPNTTAEYWWTHSVQHNDSSKVWVTNAGGGIGNHSKKETISAGGTKKFHTRLVRDSKSPPIIQAPYVRTDYGSIIDLRTNLEWFTIPSQDSLTWEQGLQYAEQFSAGTHDDWHMPNIKELFSLTDQNYSFPAIDPKFGIITQNTNYWSSTTLSNQTDKAWYMDSRYGITTYAVKSQRLPVIVVRNTHATTSLEQHSPQSTVYTHENVISITINHPQNSIHIFDILGNRILSDSTQSHEWHSPTLSIGLYIIHLVDGNTIQSFKAVILP